jgi:hypothetical protein
LHIRKESSPTQNPEDYTSIECDEVFIKECYLKLEKLTTDPFYLQQGDLIEAYVTFETDYPVMP